MGASVFIGFGEAGATFALPGARGYNIKLDRAETRAAVEFKGRSVALHTTVPVFAGAIGNPL